MADVGMPFVSYLKWVFHYGGFPARTTDPHQWHVIRSLKEGLQPL